MIRLSKEEVLELINTIECKRKHKTKGLFFRLQYAYARRSEEIAILQAKDINFKDNEITFNIARKRGRGRQKNTGRNRRGI